MRLAERFDNKTHSYLLFVNSKSEFVLYAIDVEDFEFKRVSGKLAKKSYVSDFSVVGDVALIKQSSKKGNLLYSVNLKNRTVKRVNMTIPGYKPKQLRIKEIQVLDGVKKAFVYINATVKKQTTLYALRLDENGVKEDLFTIKNKENNTISNISASYISEGVYIYTGTYSPPEKRMADVGVFMCKTIDSKVDFIKFYKFLDFDNFLEYLSEKSQKKIEKKRGKKKKKGKDLKVSFQIAIHDIKVVDGQYIFLGESYYPTYRTETYTTTDANGNTVTRTRQVFDGYQYTHAVLASFDEEGNKNWDNIVEMWPSTKPFSVVRFINTSYSEDQIKMIYSSRSSIYSKSFYTDGEVAEDKNYGRITTEESGDKVKRSYSDLDYWFDNYFIAYGAAKIKNKGSDKKKRGKRLVYFINKISYE